MYVCIADSVEQPLSKVFRYGTHRTAQPEETLRRLDTLRIDLGITRISDVTGMDRIGLPTAMAVRPTARSLVVTHGQGVTPLAAKAAALMAAVERHHAERVACPLRLSSALELQAESRILDPESIPGAAPACSPREPILWALGRGLDGSVTWVPFGLVHLDLRRPATLGSEHFAVGSGGLGAGNTLEEAIVHGVCEVVERDASARFRAASEVERQRRKLDLESVNDQLCRELLACYAPANVSIVVWDVTTQLRIPCFLCCIRDDLVGLTSPVGLVTGAGCHPSRTVALARALSEAAQRRIARLVGLSDDADALSVESQRARAVEYERFAREAAAPPVTRFLDVPTYDSETCQEDVAWLQQRFDQCDVAVAAVDLSQSKFPVHVVRAVATGLDARSESSVHPPGARAQQATAERGVA